MLAHEDLLGSLRFQTSSQNVTGSGLFEAFGTPVGSTGASVPFGWIGGADCQTDADTGLGLMGHRYYDTRTGRFLSPDPVGDGDNWYAYAGNDPVNSTDPSGLSIIYDPDKMNTQWNSGWSDMSSDYRDGDYGSYDTYRQDKNGVFQYAYTEVVGPTYSDFFMGGGMGTNMGHSPAGGMGGFFNHTNGARPSTRGPHETGMARLQRDKNGEKGDLRRAEAKRIKDEKKTGKSTRDPDGSVRRAREQAEREQLERDQAGKGVQEKYGENGEYRGGEIYRGGEDPDPFFPDPDFFPDFFPF